MRLLSEYSIDVGEYTSHLKRVSIKLRQTLPRRPRRPREGAGRERRRPPGVEDFRRRSSPGAQGSEVTSRVRVTRGRGRWVPRASDGAERCESRGGRRVRRGAWTKASPPAPPTALSSPHLQGVRQPMNLLPTSNAPSFCHYDRSQSTLKFADMRKGRFSQYGR
jgi:hypothetical protein